MSWLDKRMDEAREKLGAMSDERRDALKSQVDPAYNPRDAIMDLLHEREMTHGSFEDHARITQRLKAIVWMEADGRGDRGQPELTAEQFESLDMICHKIGRIIAGDADYADHWDDIAGYAKLCSKPSDEDIPTVSELKQRRNEARWGEGTYGPTTAPTEENGGLTLEKIAEIQRIMAEDGWQNAAFGEGDETTYFERPDGGTAQYLTDETPVGCSERAHAWIVADCPTCNPVPMPAGDCPLDGRNCDHEHPTPKWDTVMKRPCSCERGRCKVENGWTLGLDVFCCQAEEGKY